MIDPLPAPTNGRRRSRRTVSRLLWIGAGLFSALLAGSIAYLLVDEDPPDDSDFRFTRTIASDEENGFVVATEEVDVEIVPADAEEEEERRREARGDPGDAEDEDHSVPFMALPLPFQEGWNADEARLAVALHPRVLLNFEESLRRPKFVAPEGRSYDSLDGLSNVQPMAALASLRAGVLFEDGSERAAMEEAIKIVALGHRIERAESGLLAWSWGASIKTTGVGVFNSMIQRTNLADHEVESAFRELDRYGVLDQAWRTAIRNEYAEAGRLIDDLADGASPRSWTVKLLMRFALNPNRTRRLLLEKLRPVVRFQAPWNGTGKVIEPTAWSDGPISWWPPKNLTGKYLADLFHGAASRILETAGREHVLLQTPRLLFALRKFHRARGALPDRLEELVSEFIEKLPVDPFSGGPFKYSKEKGELRDGRFKEPVAMIELAGEK